ncbi:MAG: (2Fe-2S) ferredoxin domain-containing protein [Hymenobacteraceae bacterium]|nr:(2Fe-2S) ferredoxin domain-containing protein [Hymenobacteraceae bacterium]MDX5396158.1 (2Fe-2S) ferredoxin domain-containing protein [Hymenobacteraceae bacterium]MDX5443757.1 (2Fe-2S) ferredoxin domain-containing protein [Hymenobacteraceae bacterium]MDX5512221.1 (2Fe-2S) ferredoxin domain-containing protein [Hymenobacteraceae bacterium]
MSKDKNFSTPDNVIYVCTGSKCKKKGGKEIGKAFRALIKENGLKGKVEVIKTDCTDRCDFAPVMCFQPQNEWHHHMSELQAQKLFADHFLKKNT